MTERTDAIPASTGRIPTLEAVADLLPATVRTRIDAAAGRLYAERVRVQIGVYVELRAGELQLLARAVKTVRSGPHLLHYDGAVVTPAG